jgi:PIN domain nuclease of toxin-antitoxin system
LRLLLDTHILLWALTDSPFLSRTAHALLRDATNDVYVSSVSIWEIAIKYGMNRGNAGDMPITAEAALAMVLEATYELLSIEPEHAVVVGQLPLIHRDPFDRLLVAQACHENIHLLTHDSALAEYGDSVLIV